mgnify:CR=1 FL=1
MTMIDQNFQIDFPFNDDDDLSRIICLVNSVDGDLDDIYLEQFIVVRDKNEIVGCGRLKDFDYFNEIASIAVTQKYRKRGIGEKIVEYLIDVSDKPIFLLCVDENVGFFKKFGFKETETYPDELLGKIEKYKENYNILGL